MCAIKFCSLAFSITSRLLVINTSSFVSCDQQTLSLTATSDKGHQLAMVWYHCVYNTWLSHHWQHVMKRDIGRNQRFFDTPPAFNTPLGGSPSEYCDNTWCRKTRMVWLSDSKIFFEDMLICFWQNTQTWQTDGWTPHDGKAALCITSHSKNGNEDPFLCKIIKSVKPIYPLHNYYMKVFQFCLKLHQKTQCNISYVAAMQCRTYFIALKAQKSPSVLTK